MMYVATLDSEHYAFVAIGATKAKAIDAMVATLRAHREDHPGAWDPFDYPTNAIDMDAPHPDEDLDGWLRWLATEWYEVRLHGPLKSGAVGTRDGERLHVRA